MPSSNDMLKLVAELHDARSTCAVLVARVEAQLGEVEPFDADARQRLAWARDDVRDAYAALDRAIVAARGLI